MSLQETYASPASLGYPKVGRITAARLEPYYQGKVLDFKNIIGSGNACGQSTMAILLTYWKRIAKSNPLSKNVEGLYKASWGAPDMAGGFFGTSIERVRDVLQRYGLQATGFNVHRNTVNSSRGKKKWLIHYLAGGYPVAVIMDLGFLYGGVGAHWAVVVGYNREKDQFAVGNFRPGYHVDSRTSPTVDPEGVAWFPAADFMKAWQSNLPGIHFGAVTCRP